MSLSSSWIQLLVPESGHSIPAFGAMLPTCFTPDGSHKSFPQIPWQKPQIWPLKIDYLAPPTPASPLLFGSPSSLSSPFPLFRFLIQFVLFLLFPPSPPPFPPLSPTTQILSSSSPSPFWPILPIFWPMPFCECSPIRVHLRESREWPKTTIGHGPLDLFPFSGWGLSGSYVLSRDLFWTGNKWIYFPH